MLMFFFLWVFRCIRVFSMVFLNDLILFLFNEFNFIIFEICGAWFKIIVVFGFLINEGVILFVFMFIRLR